jgi:hypothetical protein
VQPPKFIVRSLANDNHRTKLTHSFSQQQISHISCLLSCGKLIDYGKFAFITALSDNKHISNNHMSNNAYFQGIKKAFISGMSQ